MEETAGSLQGPQIKRGAASLIPHVTLWGKDGSIPRAHFNMVMDKLKHILRGEADDAEVTINHFLLVFSDC